MQVDVEMNNNDQEKSDATQTEKLEKGEITSDNPPKVSSAADSNDKNDQKEEPKITEKEEIVYHRKMDLSQFLPGSQAKVADYKCPLCKGIFFHPVMDECSHIFCEECFEKAFNASKCCPVTKLELKTKPVKVLVMSDIIDKESLFCGNRGNGCTWQGLAKNLEDHLKNKCPKEYIPCPNQGCNTKMYREAFEAHEKECGYRTVQCEYCKIKLPFNKLKEHQENCPKFKIECPQNCGEKVERQSVTEHIDKDCKNTLLKCPFDDYGCQHGEIPRKEMEEKQKEDAGIHLQLMVPIIQRLQKELFEVKETLKKLKPSTYEYPLQTQVKEPRKESFTPATASTIATGSLQGKRSRSPISQLDNDFELNINTPLKNDHQKMTSQISLQPMPIVTSSSQPQQQQRVFDSLNMSNFICVDGNIARYHCTAKPEHRFLFAQTSFDVNSYSGKYSFSVKFHNTSVWIGVGLCDKEQVIANKMKFASPIRNFNHGCYIISSNAYSWNCSISAENNVVIEQNKMPNMTKGSTIDIEFNQKLKTLVFKGNKTVTLSNVVPITKGNTKLTPCVLFLHTGDSIEMHIKN